MAAFLFLIDWAVKGTVLLAAACIVTAAQRRASAAARHLTWTLALAGVLAVPLVSLFTPSWRVPVAWTWLAPAPAQVTLPSGRTALAAPVPHMLPNGMFAQVHPNEMRQRMRDLAAVEAAPVETPPAAALLLDPHDPWTANVAWRVIALWGIGALTFCSVLLLGCVHLRQLRHASAPLADEAASTLAQDLATRLGIRRRVRLLRSKDRQIPMTWGLFRPVVLLPDDVKTWPMDRLRMVLVHELGHVRRWDCFTQVVAFVARAMFWFHPLAWWAGARQRVEQENACDDLVLAHGGPAEDYAEHLLAVTAGLPADFFAAALALGAVSNKRIGKRLTALLDAGRNRRPLGRWRCAALWTTALALVLIIGSAAWLNGAAQAQQPVVQEQPKTPPAAGDTLKRLQEVHQKLKEHYVAPLDEQQLLDAAIKGLLGGLKDPYTDLLPAETLGMFQSQQSGTLTGIGAQLKIVNKKVAVVTPLEDSPALRAGLRPGDVIEAIDGATTDAMTLEQAVKKIIGQAGTVVKLKVIHPDGADEQLAITRAAVRIATVHGFQRDDAGRWQFLLDPEKKIGYVHILQFSKATADEVRTILHQLDKDGLKGLILDLRFCPGGLLDQGLQVAGLFIDKGTLLTVRGAGKQEREFAATGKDPKVGDVPLVVLVNEQTASAAEIVAGALHDHKRAVLVGSRTFGKGSIQTLVKLDDGSALKVTTAHHFLPSGRNIQKRPGAKAWGVDPTDGYYVPMTAKQMQTLQESNMERSKTGFKKGERPAGPAQPDPQLAGALRTMLAKLTDGDFVPVGQPQAALQEQMRKLDELQERRAALVENLQQLDRDIEDVRRTPKK